jgi:hypothetical protein
MILPSVCEPIECPQYDLAAGDEPPTATREPKLCDLLDCHPARAAGCGNHDGFTGTPTQKYLTQR